MTDFIGKDFLLETNTAKVLFHDIAENMPICDYHCHLSAKDIYCNIAPENISELWFSHDHYKWRAMRSCGADEYYCTGNADDEEKFLMFAKTIQYAIGNPLYHWAHLELQKYFDIYTPINSSTAKEIYDEANSKIKNGDFRPQTLIKKSNVKVICTTDDPTDSLMFHTLIKNDLDDFDCKVLPTFRPDNILEPTLPDFPKYIKRLAKTAKTKINSISDLINATKVRMKFFNSIGCKMSDHSFGYIPLVEPFDSEKDEYTHTNIIFEKALNGKKITEKEAGRYKLYIFKELAKMYKELDWTMEIHIGALRNNNSRILSQIGKDTGFDSIDDKEVAKPLSVLLDSLEKTKSLPKTVLFNLNDKDNCVIASMLGNFQSPEVESKIQYGPAWWFLDTIDGMTNQIKTLANYGILGKFIGMETDSRSFTSYARHDYFRRVLCNIIGNWVENGLFENNKDLLKEIVEGICYKNAIKYFNF